jgi:hypothetical protein
MSGESFVMRVLGVANGFGADGSALVFGRRIRTCLPGNVVESDEESRSCCVRVMDVPRRIVLGLRHGTAEGGAYTAISEMFTVARAKATSMNNAFGDVAVCGYGAVRCIKVFVPRNRVPMPAGRLDAYTAVLCTGAASAAEELTTARRLCTGTLALVEDAVPAAVRATTAELEYKVQTIKSVTGLPEAGAWGPEPWNTVVACIDVRTGTTGEFAVSVQFSRAELGPLASDETWPELRHADIGPPLTPGPGVDPVAALAEVHRAIEMADPDVLVFRSTEALRALQSAADATGISALGFAFGIKNGRGGQQYARSGRRGVCLLSDWGGAGDDVVGAEGMSRAFGERAVLWSAMLLARESRATLFGALAADVKRLSESLLLAELHDRRIVAPDWKNDAAGPARYEGGLVLDARCGLHLGGVCMLDFKGLYPSLVMEHGICFTDRPSCRGPGGKPCTSEEQRVLPAIMERLSLRRTMLQLLLNPAAARLAAMLKLEANAALGGLGQRGSRFECLETAERITAAGRAELRGVVKIVETATAADGAILGGDTDSVFFRGDRSAAEAVVAEVNRAKRFVCMRVERRTDAMLIVGKKQYAHADGVRELAHLKPQQLIVKGLEMVKANYPPITAACCSAALSKLLL